MRISWRGFVVLFVAGGGSWVGCPATLAAADAARSEPVETALDQAGENRKEIQAAIDQTPADEREGMLFLIANMPQADLRSLSADFLREHVQYAYRAWNESPWKADVPKEIFLNDILPYASIDERRDKWRKDFYERFKPLVAEAKQPGAAGVMLNQKLWGLLKVQFSTARKKANQSPYETMESHIASCSGLAVLLIDACRAVGVPARFVGTPLWSDLSGNHSWVEIWDKGDWHFTGAAEPAGDKLDEVWFGGRAAAARGDEPVHAIYATRFEKSSLLFPIVWSRRNDGVYAVNVTNRYTRRRAKPAETEAVVRFRVLDKPDGKRQVAKVKLTDADGKTLLEGTTRDDRFDPNDHLEAVVAKDRPLHVAIQHREGVLQADIVPRKSEELFTFHLSDAKPVGFDAGIWESMRDIKPRQYLCHHMVEPITLDGRAEEAAWKSAPWTDDFVDIEGDKRPLPRFRTRAKMLWDDNHLYIHAELDEPHVWGTITKQNAVMFHDNDFEVFIDPDGDNHHYYEMEMNALNTTWELSLDKPYLDGGPAIDPDVLPDLKTAVHVRGTINDASDTDEGWSVEIALPWKSLKKYADTAACPPEEGATWRVGLSRVEWLIDIISGKYHKIPKEMRNEDNWIWSPQGIVNMHRPERWGQVQFTREPAGKGAFVADATLPARQALMEVYHRQRAFRDKHDRYATSLDELGLDAKQTPPALAGPLVLDNIGDGYFVTARIALPNGKIATLHTRQDSRLWRSEEKP